MLARRMSLPPGRQRMIKTPCLEGWGQVYGPTSVIAVEPTPITEPVDRNKLTFVRHNHLLYT